MSELILDDYWRSGAAYRTRIALHLKGLPFLQRPIDLRTGAQRDPTYLARNGQGLVPTLEAEGLLLTQSGAILEWLEETYPDPPLLPSRPNERATVRAMAAAVGCDIHPLNSLRVLQTLRTSFSASEAQVGVWITRWITEGFEALERMIDAHGGLFAYGDAPTFADCFLVPQVYSAERFQVPLTSFAAICRVTAHARQHPSFEAAHPDRQPGSPC